MNSTLSRTIAALATGLTLSSVAACAGIDDSTTSPPAATTTSSSPTAIPSSRANKSSPASGNTTDGDYRDGNYSAKGWYGGGPSSIDVEVTLADDVITAVEVRPNATNPTSLEWQNRFIGGVSEAVVGRDVDEVELDRVAGSSTTPDGFNDALRQIRTEASR